MKGIVWLASYPKSGNTWFRVFLTNLLWEGPADINKLYTNAITSSRETFDYYAGIDSQELDSDEIDLIRPTVFRLIAQEAKAQLYMKVHDAYTFVAEDRPLIPPPATSCALYFLRNPLDVAVSFAHHGNLTFDRAVNALGTKDYKISDNPRQLSRHLRQHLLSWSEHVLSWVDRPPFPVCVLRYEDMILKPQETFEKAVRFINLPHSAEQIAKAVEASAFDRLQAQETATGFQERAAIKSAFFRKGKIGSWREELNEEQVQKIVSDHRDVMKRFGYLDEHDQIVFG